LARISIMLMKHRQALGTRSFSFYELMGAASMRRFGSSRLVLAFVFVCVAGTGSLSRGDDPAKPDDARKQALTRLQGTWQLIHAESEGKVTPAEAVARTTVTVEGEKHTVRVGENVIVKDVPFVFDPTTTPPSTEDTVKGADGAEHKIRGIYRQIGDVLVSCVGATDAERPTKFQVAEGSGCSLRVFRRKGSEAQEKAVAAALPKFAGTWTISSQTINGQDTPAEQLQGTKLEIDANGHFVTITRFGKLPGIFAVNPIATPGTIDLVLLGGPVTGAVITGIYQLDGNRLVESVIPNGKERPRNLDKPGAGDPQTLQVLERQP
jgi:uncharacterized protein (TIGR03067 family)